MVHGQVELRASDNFDGRIINGPAQHPEQPSQDEDAYDFGNDGNEKRARQIGRFQIYAMNHSSELRTK